MQTILDNNYLAAIYLRLSKEDGDLSTTGGKLKVTVLPISEN